MSKTLGARSFNQDEIKQIVGLKEQGKSLKEIRIAVGAKTTRQIKGVLLIASNIAAGRVPTGKANNEPKVSPPPGVVPPLSIVDRTPVNATAPIQSPTIQVTNNAQMTSQKANGTCAVRRLEPIDMAGYVGSVPFPYSPESVGKAYGAGKYEVCIGFQNGYKDYQIETVPDSFGPPRNPSLYSGSQSMNQPATDPASGIRAAGEVIKIVQDLGQKKQDGPVEQATARMIDAQTANLNKPAAPDARAMTLDDFIRAQQAQQTGHDKRMEEIRVESAAQAAKIKAEADASVAKTIADSNAAIAKAQADAKIREDQDKSYHTRMRDLEKEDRDRRDADMRKALKEAGESITTSETRLKQELKDQRAADEKINGKELELLKQQGNNIVEVAKVNAEILKLQAQLAGGDGSLIKILKEVGPYIKDGINAAERIAKNDPNQQQIPAAPQPNALPAPSTGGDVSDSILDSVEFKAFIADYETSVARYVDDAEALAAGEMVAAAYTPELYFARIVAEIVDGKNQAAWRTIVDTIGKRRWKDGRRPGMKSLIWPKLKDEQKTLLDNPRAIYFYEKVRADLINHFDRDAKVYLQNLAVEKAMRGTEPAPKVQESVSTPATEETTKPPAAAVTVEA